MRNQDDEKLAKRIKDKTEFGKTLIDKSLPSGFFQVI